MRETKNQSLKPLGYYFMALILVGTFLSWCVWSGYLFGTLSVDDNYYQDEFDYNYEGKNYSCKYWMGMVLESIDGFFVNTDITLHISDGFIEYKGENISQENNITIVLQFLPPARQNRDFFGQSEHIQTKFDGEKKYKLSTSSITINYPVSEIKRLKPVIFIDGDIIAGGLEEYEFIEIQPAYTKTQLNHTKAVTMFTIWIIIFTVMAFIFEIVKWLDPRKIKNDKEVKKMIKFEDLKWKDSSYIIGFIILLALGTILTIYKENQLAFFLVTLGFAILSVGLAFKALEIGNESTRIAKESRDIADESNEKMKALANADFFELTYRFWEKAPKLYYPLDFSSRDTCSWHLVNYFNHADKLKKWADSDVQEKLINALKIFLERLRPTTCKKFWVEIKNYMGACNIALGFKADEDVKNKLIDELTNWIGKKQKGESNQEYLQRKSNELSKMKKSVIFEITG